MTEGIFTTEDVKLATYLAVLGHDGPVFRLAENSRVLFEFSGIINQASILSFYGHESELLSPLSVLEKYVELVACAKLTMFHLTADIFQS